MKSMAIQPLRCSVPRVCITTTTIAPPEQLRAFLRYHFNSGVEHAFVFCDEPHGSTYKEAQITKGVTAVCCDENYWPGGAKKRERLTFHERQWFNLRNALRWAREAGFQWIIHIDTDELLWVPQGLHSLLASTPGDVDVVRFRYYEAVPDTLERQHPFLGVRYFKVGPARPTRSTLPRRPLELLCSLAPHGAYVLRLWLACVLGCRVAWGAYLRAPVGGKSAVRITDRVQALGVHVPPPPQGGRHRIVFARKAAVLHFDGPDYRTWYAKWFRRYQETNVPRGRDAKRRRQLAAFASLYEKNDEQGLEKLFRKHYFLSAWEKAVLWGLGLLRELHLSDEHFVERHIAPAGPPAATDAQHNVT